MGTPVTIQIAAANYGEYDSQSSYRRPFSERREHENALLVNYDGSTSGQHTKHGSTATHSHDTARRHGVDFSTDQSSASARTSVRRTPLANCGSLHDPFANIDGSVSNEIDPIRTSTLNCLASASVAVVA
ncbi:unnamed protein product, partial [Rotaria magnacalcarata]